MVARDVMISPVVTIRPEATVREAADLMAAKGFGSLPVVDDKGAVVGVISHDDLIRLVLPEWLDDVDLGVLPPSATFPSSVRAGASLGDVLVREAMRREELIEVPPDEPVAEVARLMLVEEARRVVVVDGGKMVGVVSRGDVVRAIVHPRLAAAGQEQG
jgi:CBS domain-containing protein